MFVHDEETLSDVLALVGDGLNDCEIARRTGVPRRTVRDWRVGRVPKLRAPRCQRCGGGPDECGDDQHTIRPEEEYAYLLGLYLGDGYISQAPRTYRIRFFLDAVYKGIVQRCARSLEAICPGKSAWIGQHGPGCSEVSMYWNHWPCLFPQHGPGKKHLRPIVLTQWQQPIVDRNRRELIQGLIHSDGCRIVADDRGVKSVRYHFSNLSEDVKRIYCDSLDALGIPWTRPCGKQIAVYRKSATAFLDEFVGPKR
jgi:hypothetical protein